MSIVQFKPLSEVQELANKVFIEQKERINKLLQYAEVEHIGSTSIPNSITKGDLDICVRVPEDKFEEATEKLKSLYEINQPENWSNTFASFKDDVNLGIDFGLQLVIIDSKSDDFIKIRDILRENPALVEELNQLKVSWEGKNMDEYRKEKANFFQKIRESYT